MAKSTHKLTAKQITGLPEGLHSDGGNLYLRVRPGGSRQFVMLFKSDGRQREMGLGGAGPFGLSLADARSKAETVRLQLQAGIDPLTAKATQTKVSRIPTFGALADDYLTRHEQSWKNAKHRAQWRMTLEVYAKPLRDLPVNEITTAHVMSVVEPIWTTKNETASRLRGRIEAILNAARVMDHLPIDAANPARWAGHLEMILPRVSGLSRGHHAALDYSEMPVFMARLRKREAVAALTLEFLILTAARTEEVLGSTWPEIDFEEKVWKVPAARMKLPRDHEVPLCDRAIEILKMLLMLKTRSNPYIFPGQRPDQPLSEGGMVALLKRMKADVTVHGFRSTFRDWAGDETDVAREVIEAALAHSIGDKAEQAYRRKTALAKRRILMDLWENWCASGSNTQNASVQLSGDALSTP